MEERAVGGRRFPRNISVVSILEGQVEGHYEVFGPIVK